MGVCASHPEHNQEESGHGRTGRKRRPYRRRPPKPTAASIATRRSDHNAEDASNSCKKVTKENRSYLAYSTFHQQKQLSLENHTGLVPGPAGGDDEIWFDSQVCFSSDSPDEWNSLHLSESDPEYTRPPFSAHKGKMSRAGSGFHGTIVDGLFVTSTKSSEKLASTVTLFDSPILNKWGSASLDVNNDHQKLNDESMSGNEFSKPDKPAVLETAFQSNAVAPVMDGSGDSTEHNVLSQKNERTNSGSCFPHLVTSISFNEKRRYSTTKPRPKSFRKVSLIRRFSLKSNESSKSWDHREILHKPKAGSQIPSCLDGDMEGCWSMLNPSTFKLRAINFTRDKRKEAAPPFFVFEPIGVDVFFSPKKTNHVARFVDLSFDGVPVDSNRMSDLLVVNIQIPLYPASMFGSISNGEGLNLVMYFKLSEKFKEQAPSYLQEMLRKFLDDEVEKVKGLVGESVLPFRERLKIIARVMNPDELELTATEKKLVITYNEKPVLSRPQHVFFKENNYLEIDLDVHRFSFLARKSLESFQERLKLCIMDIGLVIQGNKPEELPEYMLCGVRLNRIDFNHAKLLATSEEQ